METGSLLFIDDNDFRATYYFDAWLFEKRRSGMVYASSSVLDDAFDIRSPNAACRNQRAVSIVICTYRRPESLNETLLSLTKQTFKDFEVILITEKGSLSELRDKGLRHAVGSIVAFIDDDVYCEPTWLQSVVQAFQEEGVVGVTGPTTVTREFRERRDCFKFQKIQVLSSFLFSVPNKPGFLSPVGAPSMESNSEECRYKGEVMYLECCNMAVKRKDALACDGFDHLYTGTGEWAELDLSFKLQERGRLVFNPDCKLYHRPSQAGIYKSRLRTKHRWSNFVRFQRRWIRPSFRKYFYWAFVWSYFRIKEYGWV